jgi:hypothetical protein
VDLTITIPKGLEPVLEYWEKKTGLSMADWLTSIAVGNLESEADVGYKEEIVDKTMTLDNKVKAVDWTAKAVAMTSAAVAAEKPVEELPKGEEPILGP